MSDEDGRRAERSSTGTPLIWALAAALIIAFAITLVYAAQIEPFWTVLASAGMFAAASLAAGGLVGLLFGVPRTIERESQPVRFESPSALPVIAGVGANTNLEQISDWLTKIIVGVSLTQLGTIKDGATRLFNAMASSLGGGSEGAAFAGAVVIYFAVFGFFAGWLFARLRLGVAMSNADALLSLARRAERAGDTNTAEAARVAAATTVGSITQTPTVGTGEDELRPLAARYEELRATLPPGPARTAQMDDIVRRAKQLATSGSWTPDEVRRIFQTGTEGRRIVALGLMEGDAALADFDSVLQAITDSRSAFEQYHALIVANLILSSLGPEQRAEVARALRDPAVQEKMREDTSRVILAERILSRIEKANAEGSTKG